MLYTVAQKVRFEIGEFLASWMACQAWMTRQRSIVVPMLVPASLGTY